MHTHTHTHTHTHSIGIVRPLQQFLAEDLEQVKMSKKAYYKALSEAHQITEKFGQVNGAECVLIMKASIHVCEGVFVHRSVHVFNV